MRAATKKWARRADRLAKLIRDDHMRTPIGTSSVEYIAKFHHPAKLLAVART